MNYAVLWMPTINHGNIVHPIKTIAEEKDISDRGDSLKVRVVFESDSKCISVHYLSGKEFVLFVTLNYMDESGNGMILYSYEDAVMPDGDFKFTGNEFPEVIYHIIKGFYHTHDFHEEAVDSSLKPFVLPSSDDFNFKSPNNQALLHYLECYEKVLRGYVAMSRFWFRQLRDKGKCENEYAYKVLPQFFLIVKGYEAYLNTLYNSRYNTMCRLNHLPIEDKSEKDEIGSKECERRKKLRQLAFNIENSIKFFKALEFEFDIRYQRKNTEAIINRVIDEASSNMAATTKSSKESTKLAIASIILSFIFSIVSIWYSAVLSKESSEELNSTKQFLDISIHELSGIIQSIGEQQDSLHKEVLENHELENIQSSLKRIERGIRNIHLQNTSDNQ